MKEILCKYNTGQISVNEVMEMLYKRDKDELTKFLDFLLKNGYCDSDVYSEPSSAIDRYMHPKLNK